MIHHELLRSQGILTLKPEGALRAVDFVTLASTVDPYIEQHGELNGLMIEAQSFPGWDDFAALVSHVRFVRDHHRRIRRIAVVSDSKLLALAPKLASHFVSAEVRAFDAADRAAALAWLQSGNAA
jgi:hypothetical protein